MRVATIVLAAGEGRRFGGAVKQLHPVDGRPMLERVLATAAEAGVGEVIVVLGANAQQIEAAVDLHGARAVVNPRWAEGQASSLAAALAVTDADAVVVVLGDGPALEPAAVRRVAEATGAAAADYGAGRSHPVRIPRSLWPSLAVTGETPGRALAVELVDCRDLAAPGDVDYA
jgi:molybdenum cofactor cytidylyltransferase